MKIRLLIDLPALNLRKGQEIECGESRARAYISKGKAELINKSDGVSWVDKAKDKLMKGGTKKAAGGKKKKGSS